MHHLFGMYYKLVSIYIGIFKDNIENQIYSIKETLVFFNMSFLIIRLIISDSLEVTVIKQIFVHITSESSIADDHVQNTDTISIKYCMIIC